MHLYRTCTWECITYKIRDPHHVVLHGGSRSKIYWHHLLFIPQVSTIWKEKDSSAWCQLVISLLAPPDSGCFPLEPDILSNMSRPSQCEAWIKWLPLCRWHAQIDICQIDVFWFKFQCDFSKSSNSIQALSRVGAWHRKGAKLLCDPDIAKFHDAIHSLHLSHNGAMASQIASLTIAYSNVYSGADQRKPQRSASLAFVRGVHRWPVNSPPKWPITRKMFPFDDVIM